jgi:hypothetical protein
MGWMMMGRYIEGLSFSLSIFLLFFFLSAGASARAEVKNQAFGLVVGYNGPRDKNLELLRFADDDAINNRQLLLQYNVHVTLITEIDKESRSLFPQIVAAAPTAERLQQAWQKINGAMARARQAGVRPIFYFFYSGHGDVQHNQGFLYLKGGKLWRKDLLRMLQSSQAQANHVVIDSCKSYYMVFERGVGGLRRPLSGNFVEVENRLPANTGLLLSTSSAEDSHEWGAIQSGIFSHELRSALRGAADINRDSIITYQEAAAFIWNANRSIPNRQFRPAFFAWKPTDQKVAAQGLLSLKDSVGDRLYIGPGYSHHFYIEDANGVRLLDFHAAKSQELALLLPTYRPLYLHHPLAQQEMSLPPQRVITLRTLSWRKSQLAKRGAKHLAFKKIFAQPFAAHCLKDYERALSEDFIVYQPVPLSPWWRRSLLLASPLLAAGGAAMFILAQHERDSLEESTRGKEVEEINQRVNTYQNAGIGLSITAGASLASYLVWTLLFNDENNHYIFPNLFSSGAALNLQYRY